MGKIFLVSNELVILVLLLPKPKKRKMGVLRNIWPVKEFIALCIVYGYSVILHWSLRELHLAIVVFCFVHKYIT